MQKRSTGLLTNTRNRQVPLRGRITKQVASCCVARLLILASEDPRQPVVMQIDTPGGSVSESLMLISTIKGLKCPVRIVCQGQVGGTAIAIAAQGSPGWRTALPLTRFSFQGLLHERTLTPGTRQLLAEILAQSTKRSVSETLAWMAGGAEFGTEQAIANGLIDTIAFIPPTLQVAEGDGG